LVQHLRTQAAAEAPRSVPQPDWEYESNVFVVSH